MAIKINGDTVIDEVSGDIELQNVASITYGDATVQTSAGAGGAPNVEEISETEININTINEMRFANGVEFGTAIKKLGSTEIIRGNRLLKDIPVQAGAPEANGVMAISNDFLIVGDKANGSTAGVPVYVYSIESGAYFWQMPVINTYSTSDYDYFASAVAINDKYVAVGAKGEDYAGANYNPGVVYLYNLYSGSPYLTIQNPNLYSTADGDNFGATLDCDENYLMVGITGEDIAGRTGAGAIAIYDFAGTLLFSELSTSLNYSSSTFGSKVAIHGKYAATTMPTGTGDDEVKVFHTPSGDWTDGYLAYTITNPNSYAPTTGDNFACSIDISNGYLAVGAMNEDVGSNYDSTDAGKVYVFDLSDGSLYWTITNPNISGAPNRDYFGWNLKMSGGQLAVFAQEDTPSTSSGVVYFYDIATKNIIRNSTLSAYSYNYNYGLYNMAANDYKLAIYNQEKGAYEIWLTDDQYIFETSDKLMALVQ